MEEAIRGQVTSWRGVPAMIVSETSFCPAFRRALGVPGLECPSLDRIHVAAGTGRATVQHAVERADSVYISPLCDPALRNLAPPEASLRLVGVQTMTPRRNLLGQSLSAPAH